MIHASAEQQLSKQETRGTWHVKPYPTLGVGSGQWAKKKFQTLKFFGHLPPLTPQRVEITTGSQKKMWKCKFCAISHLIWPARSKPVKSWTFLGEIVVSLILLNRFHSESRLHIDAPRTRKSQRHHALGRVMSQKGKSTCNITIYGVGESSLEVKKILPTPGSKFFPGTPLARKNADMAHDMFICSNCCLKAASLKLCQLVHFVQLFKPHVCHLNSDYRVMNGVSSSTYYFSMISGCAQSLPNNAKSA